MLALANTPARAVEQEAIDRAIEKGVQALRGMQRPDGTWPYHVIGATALAGLTLLECTGDKEDQDVLRAADAVRKASIDLKHTYSIALSSLFLDRLGDREDEPLIESLTARLLAGQDPASGGWSYGCPPISEADKQRLEENVNKRKKAAPRPQARGSGRGRPAPPPAAGPAGFPPPPPPPPLAIQDQTSMVGGVGDNSNTQFAALGLWVGRRHGAKIQRATTRLADRFRTTQMEDGGWPYTPRPGGIPAVAPLPMGLGSTPSMTCAGLLALAIADGATLEQARQRKPDAKLTDISKDKNLSKGLEALGAVIENPRGIKPAVTVKNFGPPGAPPVFDPATRVGGRSYYFLWSLERVAVALDLKTIGNKDWYNWGAEILLESQAADGSWNGDYGAGGVDTCFALLFLKRANFVSDLTASIKGKISDPGERTLSARGKVLGRSKMS